MNEEKTYHMHDPELSHGSYGAKLFDPRWTARRRTILERDGNKCRNCGSTEKLQVHHRQYHFVTSLNVLKDPWEYRDDLLITLCEKCHRKGHQKFKVPIINI